MDSCYPNAVSIWDGSVEQGSGEHGSVEHGSMERGAGSMDEDQRSKIVFGRVCRIDCVNAFI